VGVVLIATNRCGSGSRSTSSTTTTTTTSSAPGPHSRVAPDVELPPDPRLESAIGGVELWDLTGMFSQGLPWATGDVQTRLPVNAPLNGRPWCGSTEDDDAHRKCSVLGVGNRRRRGWCDGDQRHGRHGQGDGDREPEPRRLQAVASLLAGAGLPGTPPHAPVHGQPDVHIEKTE
jgi:hypothetical protein